MKFSTEAIEAIGKIAAQEITRLGIEQLTQIEQSLREILQAGGQCGMKTVLEQLDQQVQEGMDGKYAGQAVQYHSRRPAVIWSVFGKVAYQRSYYRYVEGRGGVAPLDRKAGLEAGQITPVLGELLALAGIETAFGKATRMISKFLLVEISENTVRKETERFGGLQAQRESQWKIQAEDVEWQLAQRRQHGQVSGRVYGSIDGVMAPLQDGWHEIKAVAWYQVAQKENYQAQSHHGNRPGEQEPLQAQAITYHCDLQSPEPFGELVWSSGCQRQANLHEEVIFVCDGAVWIWKLVERWFPKAIQIVDWYHASEYLTPIAAAAFANDPPSYQAWLDQARKLLWDGEIDALISFCRAATALPGAAAACQDAVTYFTNNQHRMDYARFRREGYFIGSGTIESAVKQIVGLRLKQAGARWSLEGAVHTAKARAAWLGDAWDELAHMRAQLPLAS
jgi:hypothetical protein